MIECVNTVFCPEEYFHDRLFKHMIIDASAHSYIYGQKFPEMLLRR